MIVLVTKTDPDAGYDGFTLFLVPMDSPGVIREKRLQKLGMHASDTALLEPLRAAGMAVQLVGDCVAPRNVMAATAEGHAAGHII